MYERIWVTPTCRPRPLPPNWTSMTQNSGSRLTVSSPRSPAEAYRWTEVLTGESAASAAVLAPPVVRLRELAVAQSRLLAALNGATLSKQSAGPLLTAADRSARRVRMLGRRLQRTLRSTHRPGSLDEKHAMAPAIQGDG